MNKGMLSTVIESLMSRLVGRPVHVNFGHIGQNTDYTVAIQKSLFEFGEEEGPVGPMFITLSSSSLYDVKEIIDSLNNILEKYEE